MFEQLAESVGQLNLTGPVLRGFAKRWKYVGREEIASDDGQVGGRILTIATRAELPFRALEKVSTFLRAILGLMSNYNGIGISSVSDEQQQGQVEYCSYRS